MQAVEQPSHVISRAPSENYKWYVASLLCLAHAVSFIDRNVMILVTEPVRLSFGLTDTQLGLLQGTGFSILYCAFAIPLGWAADIVNRRNLILLGLCMWSFATVAAAFADSFLTLFITRIFVGMGEACVIPAGMSLIASYFPPSMFARGVSVFGMGPMIGHSLAFIGGGALLSALAMQGGLHISGLPPMVPWQGAFFLAGIASAPVLLLLLTLREPAREGRIAGFGPRFQHLKNAISHLWRNISGYGPLFIVTSGAATMGFSLSSWSVSALVRLHGLTTAQAGVWAGTLGIVAGPLGCLAGGWVLDRMIARKVSGASLVYLAACAAICLVAAIFFCAVHDLYLGLLSLFIFNVANNGFVPAMYVGMQVLTPDRFRGIAASVNMMIYTLIGLGLGPAVVGLLSDRWSGHPGALVYALVSLEAAMAIVIFVCAAFGRRIYQTKVLMV